VVLSGESDARKRRRDVEHEPVVLWISRAAPELTTGRRDTGDPRSRAGKRSLSSCRVSCTSMCVATSTGSPPRSRTDCCSSGERGAPFCRSTFGRKWRRARDKADLPANFRFYDLRRSDGRSAADNDSRGAQVVRGAFEGSRQQTSLRPLTWGSSAERVTGIEPAL
jgi:hypothetical protein